MEAIMGASASSTQGIEALSRRADSVDAAHAVQPPPFRWVTRVIVPTAIVVGAAALLLASAWKSLLPAVEVTAAPVIERSSEGTPRGAAVVQAAGWIEAAPFVTHASALTNGVIAEVLVLEGDRVDAGQVLARLVSEDALLALERADAEVTRREAARDEAQARLAAAQSDWDNPVERERATAVAQARLEESRALLVQLGAEIRAGEAEAERLRREHARLAPLGETRAISDGEVVDARERLNAQEAVVDALRARRDVVAAQITREEAELRAAREQQRLRTEERRELDAAKATLASEQAELARAKVEQREAELRVRRLEVTAPVSGIVVERLKEPGSKVRLESDDSNSAIVASIYDPSRVQVRVDVPLADAAKIAEGQDAEIVVDVLPNQVFRGTVTRILHRADIQKNTLQAKVALHDPSPLLRPEMLARVKFLATSANEESDSAATALFVPREAIAGGHAWVVEQFDGTHGVARRRAVTTSDGAREGWIEASGGLRPGDLVVLSPPHALKDGRRLRVKLQAT